MFKNKKFLLTSFIIILVTFFCVVFCKPVLKNTNFGLDLKGGFEVLYKVEPLIKNDKLSGDMIKKTYKAISNRVDSLGVSEPEIIVEGDKIRVKLAGVKNEDEARDRLSKPAVLSFRDTNDNLLMNSSVLGKNGARFDYNTTRQPVVALSIKDKDVFYNETKKVSTSNDNRIVIWLDFKDGIDSFQNQGNSCGRDGNMKCISVAGVKEGFASDVIIEGGFDKDQATELASLINSGSLPTKLIEVSSKTVDASFGSDTLFITGIAGIVTLFIIFILITIIYRFSGFITGLCLIVYAFLVFLIFNLIDGVLTLPGIAALILGIGMAIDASIISFERIKDELLHGKDVLNAEKQGNKRSLVAIIDANITTFIVSIILFIFGDGSVKGFATILMITIILTILIMVVLNRVIIKEFVRSGYFNNKLKYFIGLNTKKIIKKGEELEVPFKKIDFIKHIKIFISISILIILLGTVAMICKGLNLGIDFTGGSDISVKSTEVINFDNITNQLDEFEIIEKEEINKKEAYVKISNTLDKDQIKNIKNNFKAKNMSADISVISNIVKKDLTKNAIISLIIASFGIMLYIAFRFTYVYGLGAIISLTHDALIVICMFALFRLEVNFIFVAAILTIIGYSINDTIVCFDRMRENINKLYNGVIHTKDELKNIVNTSLRETLFRSILTTITTLIAVIVLLIVGVNEILNFNIALLIGLIAGSYSSMFIAAQVWYYIECKNLNKGKKIVKVKKEIEEKSIKGINS